MVQVISCHNFTSDKAMKLAKSCEVPHRFHQNVQCAQTWGCFEGEQSTSLQVCKSANCGFLAAYLGSSSRQRQMCQRSRFPGFNLDDDVLNTSSRVDRHSMFNGSMISSSHHEFQTFTNGNVWLRLDSNHIWVCLRMGYTKC